MPDEIVKYPIETREAELISAAITEFMKNSSAMPLHQKRSLEMLKKRFKRHQKVSKSDDNHVDLNKVKTKTDTAEELLYKIKYELTEQLDFFRTENNYIPDDMKSNGDIICDDFKITLTHKIQFEIGLKIKKKKYKIVAKRDDINFWVDTSEDWVTDFYVTHQKIVSAIESSQRKEEAVLTQVYEGLSTGYKT